MGFAHVSFWLAADRPSMMVMNPGASRIESFWKRLTGCLWMWLKPCTQGADLNGSGRGWQTIMKDNEKTSEFLAEPEGEKAALPSYLHGWRFLTVIRSQDPEAIAFKAMAANEGPCIVVNPELVSQEDLES